MSHFSVLVVTPDIPTRNSLADTLQPFHEFECTGDDDQYVKEVDITESFLQDYQTSKASRYVDPEGNYHNPYENRFYREPTDDEKKKMTVLASGICRNFNFDSRDWGDGKGYRPKVRVQPEGWKLVEVDARDVMTISEFADEEGYPVIGMYDNPELKGEHQYCWVRIDNNGELFECMKRTNPNKKWDWWKLGGRWSGIIKVKNSEEIKNPLGREFYEIGFNFAQKCDIDFEAMRQKNVDVRKKQIELELLVLETKGIDRESALSVWREASKIMPEVKKEFQKSSVKYLYDFINLLPDGHPVKTAQEAYVLNSFCGRFSLCMPMEESSPYEWAEKAEPFLTFAILVNGEWHQGGNPMGFGYVQNPIDNWQSQFKMLLDDVPDDHWLSIVDCHI